MTSYPNATAIKERYDSSGNTVSYECEYLLSYNNTFPQEVVPAYYNLQYPCDDSTGTSTSSSTNALKAKKYIENKLLTTAAETWYIHPDTQGEGCVDPTVQPDGILLVAVSSEPVDKIMSSMECVLKQAASLESGQCCVVVKSAMTFTPQGKYDAMNLIQFAASQLDSTSLTSGTPYVTSYAGSFASPSNTPDTMDTTSNRNGTNSNTTANGDSPADPYVSSISQNMQNTKTVRERFTPIGGVVLGGLVSAVVVFVVLLIRRRTSQQRKRRREGYHDGDDVDDKFIMTKDGIIERRRTHPVATLDELSGMESSYTTGPSATPPRNTVTDDEDEDECTTGEAFEITVLSDDQRGGLGAITASNRDMTTTAVSPKRSSTNPVPRGIVVPSNVVPTALSSGGAAHPGIAPADSYDDSLDSSSAPSESHQARFGSRAMNYAFDLGHSFKNEILGKHDSKRKSRSGTNRTSSRMSHPSSSSQPIGQHYPYRSSPSRRNIAPTTIEVVPPYPMMEETSDSEADSWAQTDGTVGSLEERLEEITAEI